MEYPIKIPIKQLDFEHSIVKKFNYNYILIGKDYLEHVGRYIVSQRDYEDKLAPMEDCIYDYRYFYTRAAINTVDMDYNVIHKTYRFTFGAIENPSFMHFENKQQCLMLYRLIVAWTKYELENMEDRDDFIKRLIKYTSSQNENQSE